MFDDVTRELSERVAETHYEGLPQEVIQRIKMMLLDSIGCALGGYITDRARIVLELIQEFGGNHQATLMGSHRTSYVLASFGNSELINALDYDYIGPLTAHVGPYVTPPCLTIAERQQAPGKDLILALALANEIGGRVVTSLAQHKVLKEEPPYYEKSPRFSYSSTVFGGVAGAGKLLGLDVEQMSNAFGIAGASTAVPATMKWQYMSGPSIMSKYNAWTGWIAQLATLSTLAAQKGFTGDTTILDGEWGFWKIVGSPFFEVETLLGDLGDVWHIGEVEFKLYPTCYIFHTGIEGITNIVKEHAIKPEDIEEIIVKGDPLAGTPNRMHKEVKGFADAQFSILFNFALAAFHGDHPGPAWQMPATFNDPRIKALMGKVKIDVHPEFDDFVTSRIKTGRVPIMWSSLVEITAKGQKFTTEVAVPKGGKGNPPTEPELIEKFKMNASYSMIKSSKVEEIIEMVNCLDEIDDVTELFNLLTV